MYKPTTKLSAVLTEHPRAAAYLASINPHLKLLGNPVVIGLMAPLHQSSEGRGTGRLDRRRAGSGRGPQ
jgi:hypothetical protein